MIYKNTYLDKEFRQSYFSNKAAAQRRVLLCLFMVLITVAIHMLLQIMYESVLTELYPQYFLQSNFTVLFTYNSVAYIFFAFYYCAEYENVTYAEIFSNRWYMLKKMKFDSSRMALTKYFAAMSITAGMYTLGFALTITISFIFKYTFVAAYLLPMYMAGLVKVMLISMFIMTLSVFVKDKYQAIQAVIFTGIILLLTEKLTGYRDIVASHPKMMSIVSLTEQPFFLLMIAAVVIMSVVCLVFTAQHASNYTLSANEYPEHYVKNYEDGKAHKAKKITFERRSPIKILIRTVLIGLLVVSIIVNVGVLIISLGSRTHEFAVNGYIPYIFGSSTMEPSIHKNDLAFFKQVDESSALKTEDIVIFTDGNDTVVSAVTKIDGSSITVDILHYPDFAEKNAMLRTIPRKEIYGVYTVSSRTLGAIILFTNTVAGRILMLVIPTLLLFFYDNIVKFLNKLKQAAQ